MRQAQLAGGISLILAGMMVAGAGVEESFTARGNEPGWRIDIAGGTLTLIQQDGDKIALSPVPEPERTASGSVYRLTHEGKPLVVTIEDKLCADTMTGMPYPKSVSLTLAERNLTGCGGDPIDLLAGGPWKIATIGDAEAKGMKDDVTIEFSADKKVSGAGPCNRFMGGYELSGEGLSIGPLAGTRMTCPQPQMDQETQLFDLLSRVYRFDIGQDGALQLITNDEKKITARRP